MAIIYYFIAVIWKSLSENIPYFTVVCLVFQEHFKLTQLHVQS